MIDILMHEIFYYEFYSSDPQIAHSCCTGVLKLSFEPIVGKSRFTDARLLWKRPRLMEVGNRPVL